MPIVTNSPGVYIEEDASLALSVNSNATAIPVFIGQFSALNKDNMAQCVRISNWLEFTALYTSNPAIAITVIAIAGLLV